MSPAGPAPIPLTRDCPVILIPSGEETILEAGTPVVIMQTLGGSYTVRSERGYLARIGDRDADALGFEAPETEDPAAPPEADGGEGFDMDAVIGELRKVYDPEIPVNVVDLGLIYECEAVPLPSGGRRVEIKMSMTAPGCGMGDVLKADARARVRPLPGVEEVDVKLVWSPPWGVERMSEEAKLQLGLY